MGYEATRQFNISADSTSFTDIMTALIFHFTNNSVNFELTLDTIPTAGESFVINSIVGDCHLAFRREGTSTSLNVLVDPDGDIIQGNSTTAATGSANASPECKTLTMTGYSKDFLLIEHEDALTIIFQDATKSFTPYGIHAGVIYVPGAGGYAEAGMTGHGCLVGSINSSGNNCWSSSSSVQAAGSKVRLMTDGNGSNWYQHQSDDLVTALGSSSSISSTSPDGSVKLLGTLDCKGSAINGSSDFKVGQLKYLRSAPFGGSPSFPNLLPRTFGASGEIVLNQGWLYIRNSLSTTGLLINCEYNGSFT